MGVSAISRIALRYSASGESSQPSGSKALDAEMPVRSIDIAEAFCASVGIMRARNGWSSRSRTRKVWSWFSCCRFGSSRLWSR